MPAAVVVGAPPPSVVVVGGNRFVTFVRNVEVVRVAGDVVVFKKRVVFVNVAVMLKELNPLKLRRTWFSGVVVGVVAVSVLVVSVVDVGKVGRVISEKEVCLLAVVVSSGVLGVRGVDELVRTDDSVTEVVRVVRTSGVEPRLPMVVVIVVSMRGLVVGTTEVEGVNGVDFTLELGASELEGINGVNGTLVLGNDIELEGINRVKGTLVLGATGLEGISVVGATLVTPDVGDFAGDEVLSTGTDALVTWVVSTMVVVPTTGTLVAPGAVGLGQKVSVTVCWGPDTVTVLGPAGTVGQIVSVTTWVAVMTTDVVAVIVAVALGGTVGQTQTSEVVTVTTGGGGEALGTLVGALLGGTPGVPPGTVVCSVLVVPGGAPVGTLVGAVVGTREVVGTLLGGILGVEVFWKGGPVGVTPGVVGIRGVLVRTLVSGTLGVPVGVPLGILVGGRLGVSLGMVEMVLLITPVGGPIGTPVGGPVGTPVGGPVGTPVGGPVGTPVGGPVGTPVGGPVGTPVGGPPGVVTPGGSEDGQTVSQVLRLLACSIAVCKAGGTVSPAEVNIEPISTPPRSSKPACWATSATASAPAR